jgi:lipopolysaccharide/colanic/teichoic acid biosynthesis glycosyltransferase
MTSYPALFGRHALDWEERMPLDIWYVENWSLKLDLKILLGTLPVWLTAKNIYDPKGGSHLRSKPEEMGFPESP